MQVKLRITEQVYFSVMSKSPQTFRFLTAQAWLKYIGSVVTLHLHEVFAVQTFFEEILKI